MNINLSIVAQRLNSIQENIREQAADTLNIKDENRLKSLAFVYLCVKTVLDLDHETVFDCLTEGGGDFGVDGIHLSEEYDGEFTISLFQAKYKRNLEGDSHFSESGLKALVNAIRYLFDPNVEIQAINERLEIKIEEARSLIQDGYIPQVRVLACNNGLPWNQAGQATIDRENFGSQVTWEHINHDRLIAIFQSTKSVNKTLQLSGKAIVEDMNFSRVLVGRIAVQEIAKLIERHGERLLERNIRRYLGLQGNRINEGMRDTLKSSDHSNFYLYNNGITLTCDKFSYNALQGDNYQVKIDNLQIINGGQTCITIYKTLQSPTIFNKVAQSYVLVRLYELPNDDFVRQIALTNNSQNPVHFRDLKANDSIQERLEMDIKELGYIYRRKRATKGNKNDITSEIAAAAILSVWCSSPHQARVFSSEHFGKLYKKIFSNSLNGSQVITAVLLYRIAKKRRRNPHINDPIFVRYASCFIAMQMGKRLLQDLGIQALSQLEHRNFEQAVSLIEEKGETSYFEKSCQDMEKTLKSLYGNEPDQISLQQLSATFRRGDLIRKLTDINIT
ncbi:MAG: AIPR family protein [Microcystaceae cyanobacterium]